MTPPDPFAVSRRERAVALGSVLGGASLALLLGLALAHARTLELLGLMAASFAVAGKFLPLWGLSGESTFSAWQLGVCIWLMDTGTVVVLVYGLASLRRIGVLDRFFERAHANARLVLDAYPRMRRAAIVGVTAFVLFPIAGTGAIGGTFVGLLLGMNRFVLIACVSTGGLLGGMGMAALAVHFEATMRQFQAAQHDPTIKYALLGVVGLTVAGAAWRMQRAYRRALAQAATRPPRAQTTTPPDDSQLVQ